MDDLNLLPLNFEYNNIFYYFQSKTFTLSKSINYYCTRCVYAFNINMRIENISIYHNI